MAKFYAWSNIRYGAEVDENGLILSHKEVTVGEEVTANKIGVSQEEWDHLVETGVVRTQKYPDEANPAKTVNPETPARLETNALVKAVEGEGLGFVPTEPEPASSGSGDTG